MQEYGVKDHRATIFGMVIVAMAVAVTMVRMVLGLMTFLVFE